MFWDKIIPAKFYAKSEVCAVKVRFSDSGKTYYYVRLNNKSNKLELIETGVSEDVLVLPETILKNKIPIVVVVNGKGVIVKKIVLPEDKELEIDEIIKQNLPALNPAEFYIQLYKQEDHSAFIVLCRKNQLDEIISEFKNKKYDLGDILLGTPSVIGLKPLWSNFNSILTSIHRLELSNNVLDAVVATDGVNDEMITLDSISFHVNYTLGFAAGLSYLMRRQIAITNSPTLDLIREQHIERNKLRFLTLLAVGIAFFVALVNVFFYTSYFDKNNKLETELSVYQGKYEQINELLSDYQKNKDLIENAGVLNKNKLSEFADRIGKTLPDEVVLSDLYFNPKKDDEESEDSLITFQNKHMVLKGNCSKSFIVNEWINVLKMQKFIRDVSLEKFVYNNEGMLPNFEIRLITE